MTTKESNRLIADFMGIKPSLDVHGHYFYLDMPWFCVREDNLEKVMDAITDYVKYDKRWNWLMPVVQKIYSFKIEDEPVLIIRDALADASLRGTYDAVVEFILWYNENYKS
jgi:hypothetical protein